MTYEQFLDQKRARIANSGFNVEVWELNGALFPFQRYIVKKALEKGKYAIFADCGLGKTLMQMEWARQVAIYTDMPVLILAPLAVSGQTIQEGEKFGIKVRHYRWGDIQITNYEQLDNIDPSQFSGVVLDESSILKNFTGAIKQKLIAMFADTPFKLCCTATPSPNDPEELGNHSEFLNAMTRSEMLAMYFIHDGGDTGSWKLKPHGHKYFWNWVSEWAVMLCNPADIGFPMDGYDLPELKLIEKKIITTKEGGGFLFSTAVSATNFNQELRLTKVQRLAEAAAIAIEKSSNQEDVIIWIKHNDEGVELLKLIPNSIEISGNGSTEFKENVILWFTKNQCICPLLKKNGRSITIDTTKKTRNDLTPSQEQDKQNEENMSRGLEKKELSTIGFTTENTSINISNTTKPPRKEEIKEGENFTQPTPNTERIVNENQEKQIGTTQKQPLEGSLKRRTELPLKNIENCLISRVENAQSVEASAVLLKKDKDCMSTIVIQPEESGDYYAQTAIMPSENSKTISCYSKEPLCTCGANKKGKILISKYKILGLGINMQNCHNQIFPSLDFSFEGLYQAIRRSYRYGQQHPVNIWIITTDTMTNVIQTIHKKQKQFLEMQNEMNVSMNPETHRKEKEARISEVVETDLYTLKLGDCVPLINEIPDESIGFSIFSPPFAELYVYSDELEDMGNSKDYKEFLFAFNFLVKDLYRVLWSGRNVAVHCMDLPIQKGKEGYIGLRDFSNMIRQAFEDVGFIYHSRVTIWKEPVTEMQRTKALGLLHKQVKKDSAMSRVALPDYLLVFRKPGEHENPVKCDIPVDLWQKYASPVWMDINYSDTLNGRSGRDENDGKHIAPLQLQTIERAIHLWTNKGDTVLTPFLGIGSEVFKAVEIGRKGIGFELKASYFKEAVKNCAVAMQSVKNAKLF